MKTMPFGIFPGYIDLLTWDSALSDLITSFSFSKFLLVT